MSNGMKFIQFVEELKAVGFPIDKLPGGEIQKVFDKGLSVREAIYELHGQCEQYRIRKQLNKLN